jgi:hypothetical protein
MTKRTVVFGVVLCTLLVGTSSGYQPRPPSGRNQYFLARTDTSGQILCSKNYGFGWQTSCDAVIALKEGGFALVGEADSCQGHHGHWLLVTDHDGNHLWDHCYHVRTRMGECAAMKQSHNGQIVMAGSVDYDYMWMRAVSETGDIVWAQNYGLGCLRAFALTNDSGFLLTGYTGVDSMGWDGWIMKTDSVGIQQWYRTFGGPNEDFLYDLMVTEEGRIIAVGESYVNIPYPPGPKKEGWVLTTDISGNVLQNRQYPWSNSLYFTSVQPAPDGGYILSGDQIRATETQETHHDQVITKISQTGDTLWNRVRYDDWDKVDPVEIAGEGVCSVMEYAERIVKFNAPEAKGPFVIMTKLAYIPHLYSDPRNEGFLVGPVGAGILPDGYYYVATFRHPTPPDSVWYKMFPERRLVPIPNK